MADAVLPQRDFPPGTRYDRKLAAPPFFRRELVATFSAQRVSGTNAYRVVWEITNLHTQITRRAVFALFLPTSAPPQPGAPTRPATVAIPPTPDVPAPPPDPASAHNFASIDEAHAGDDIVGVAEFYDVPTPPAIHCELEVYPEGAAVGATTWVRLLAP